MNETNLTDGNNTSVASPTLSSSMKQGYKAVTSSPQKVVTEADESHLQIEMIKVPQQQIEFTFKIEGMTCVACSSSIERLMH